MLFQQKWMQFRKLSKRTQNQHSKHSANRKLAENATPANYPRTNSLKSSPNVYVRLFVNFLKNSFSDNKVSLTKIFPKFPYKFPDDFLKKSFFFAKILTKT